MQLSKVNVGQEEREEGQDGEAEDAKEQKRIDPLCRKHFVRGRRKVYAQQSVPPVDRPLQDHQWHHEQEVLDEEENVEGNEKSLRPSPTFRDGESASSEPVDHLPVPVDRGAEEDVEALQNFPRPVDFLEGAEAEVDCLEENQAQDEVQDYHEWHCAHHNFLWEVVKILGYFSGIPTNFATFS